MKETAQTKDFCHTPHSFIQALAWAKTAISACVAESLVGFGRLVSWHQQMWVDDFAGLYRSQLFMQRDHQLTFTDQDRSLQEVGWTGSDKAPKSAV